jgi:nucleotide-binding universal stress UspA family protein
MIALNRILCPVDLSDPSRRALEQAARLARGYQATLVVLAVAGTPEAPLSETPPVVRGLDVQSRARILAALESFTAPVVPTGVQVEIRLEEGEVVAEIVRAAEAANADLLVMGTHGRGGFERFVLGSVANKVLRKVACPVLTVPPGMQHEVDEPGGFGTVLCALDFSDAASQALPYALSLAQEAGGKLLLMHVVEWPTESQVSPRFDALRDELAAAARRRLAEAIPDGARDWCQPEVVVVPGNAAKEIVAMADTRHADLIVMGLGQRSALDRALNGTTAYQVIRTAPCAVLTVRQVVPSS